MKAALFSMLLAGFVMTLPTSADAQVTVYKHCGFKGRAVTLGVGSYKLGRLIRMGVKNDDISALTVAPGYQVTVYEHNKFRGRNLTFKHNVRCLVKHNFNDKISSIIVSRLAPPPPVNVATVYQHCGFRGYRVSVPVGSYDLKRMRRLGIKNDDLSALSVLPGYRITIYEHAHFRGRSRTFGHNVKCLVKHGFNDKISSFIVTRR